MRYFFLTVDPHQKSLLQREIDYIHSHSDETSQLQDVFRNFKYLEEKPTELHFSKVQGLFDYQSEAKLLLCELDRYEDYEQIAVGEITEADENRKQLD